MASLDTANNFDINYKNVEAYHKFISYKNRLLNTYTINSDGTHVYSDEILDKLEEVRVKDYILNVDAYYINPFFLHYSSDEHKGIIVNGELLSEDEIKCTERYNFNFKVDVLPGTTKCVKRTDLLNEEITRSRKTNKEIKNIIRVEEIKTIMTRTMNKEIKTDEMKKDHQQSKCSII